MAMIDMGEGRAKLAERQTTQDSEASQ